MSPNTTNTTNPPDTKYLAHPKTESSKKSQKKSSNHIEMYHFDQKRKTKRLSVGDERLLYYKNRKRKIYNNNNKRKIKVTISNKPIVFSALFKVIVSQVSFSDTTYLHMFEI